MENLIPSWTSIRKFFTIKLRNYAKKRYYLEICSRRNLNFYIRLDFHRTTMKTFGIKFLTKDHPYFVHANENFEKKGIAKKQLKKSGREKSSVIID